ncbi:MAG: hypothetical protein ABGZ24_11565, partial [Fuerstiella sp.]
MGYARSPQSGTAPQTTEALEDRCLLSVVGVEGSPVTVSQVFADVGLLDSDTATINWGNGNTTPGTVGGGSDTVTGSHVYADNGEYTVTITVTGDHLESHSDTVIATMSRSRIPDTKTTNTNSLPHRPLHCIAMHWFSSPFS